MQTNIMDAAHETGVKNFVFFGASCIYPKNCKQPIKEDYLLTGPLEKTNEPYAIAKIAGVKMCESYSRQYIVDYRSVMPTNLYGPGDNYHPENSHVIPALIRKFHEAKVGGKKSVVIWGSGRAKREFLYVDDLAEACISVMELDVNVYQSLTKPQQSFLNVGYGTDISILELCDVLKGVVDFNGEIIFDSKMPDGAPRKLMDSSKIQSIGWKPTKTLKNGLHLAYENYLKLYENKNDR
jgi:GDP-L-fucose synthase